MRRIFSVLFTLAGIGSILAGLYLLRDNQAIEAQAGAFVDAALSQLVQQTPAHEIEQAVPKEQYSEETLPQETLPPEPRIVIDGYTYLGTLDFPSLKLTLPVLSEYSDENVKLAPCRYSGTRLEGDMVIAGHNYARHFHYVSGLGIGEKLSFTDANGTVYQYKIVQREVLDGTAVEEMLAGDWDMTLFTCTYGGKGRVALRCNEMRS